MSRLNLTETVPEGYRALLRSQQAVSEGPLDSVVGELVKTRVSQLNGCLFCVDMHTTEARRAGESERRLHHLAVWHESPLYTARERAALRYAEAVTRREDVDDAHWEELRGHFPDEAELGHLVLQVALINALNRLAVPLRKEPDSAPPAA
ncbi:carboxymuconolactone decarboxylase family protein [Streptomyces carpaticus]|uniref:Carboxymuconolactone decarboxylase family protein n=1 Tax=Streptomyces carpaticus TaxID=285558 RepID=A0ABV4ZR87_9ACTN